MSTPVPVADSGSIIAQARDRGLDTSLLYESVIELASEGLLTAGAVNAAAGILLADLGLPNYFFGTISKEALKRVLWSIAMNIEPREGRFVLRSEVSEARLSVDGGVQARIATAENRDRMEAVLNPVMAGRRVEYYFGRARQYFTYIIRPEPCKAVAELAPGESPFAFNQIVSGPPVPDETRVRYESFLRRCAASVIPLVEVSDSPATRETRVMFRDDFGRSALPTIRRMLTELGLTLNRGYWETYRVPSGRMESICSLYLDGRPGRAALARALERLHALLAIQAGDLDDLYVGGALTFDEYIFAIAASAFVHNFIYKDLDADRDMMNGLTRKELRDALTKRVFDSNRAEYFRKGILDTIRQRPDLLKRLFELFDRTFNPRRARRARGDAAVRRQLEDFRRDAAIAFIDDRTGFDIFSFMTRMVTQVRKTNFYKVEKRSCAFRLDRDVLDPLVFPGPVHGVFFVVGFYAIGMHMRAEDIARGGLRLIRVTAGNYETELDNAPLLNYALGPVAQRLKHKDIAESGAKGVIVPAVEYARDGLEAVFDVTEGILDLIQPSPDVVDRLGQPEMIFFGPDEGTAGYMDAVAERAKARGYRHWRTITTGKSIGIPHDAYGLTSDRRVFGLLSRGAGGTELQIDGMRKLVTTDPGRILAEIGDRIDASGMTTMGVMACLRTMFGHLGLDERDVNLMMTGGPDGDLGANQIQSFRGRVCLIVDGGSVLFDPDGLDRTELMKIAVARHTSPRLNSMAYPESALGPRGFRIPRAARPCALPDGTVIADGAFLHRRFLVSPQMRPYIAAANIRAFVPCGGFKDTINAENAGAFIELFRELRVIVEGANVFFDDTAREAIARKTGILQIRDSSANKGGVTSSAIAEVLTAFLLGDAYERTLVRNPKTRSALVRAVFDLIRANAEAETRMLLALHAKTGEPLYALSVRTSEQLFALQGRLYARLDAILRQRPVVEAVLRAYVPHALLDHLGMARVVRVLGTPELRAYRDALLTKKLAAMALYRHAADWDAFLKRFDADVLSAVRTLVRAG